LLEARKRESGGGYDDERGEKEKKERTRIAEEQA